MRASVVAVLMLAGVSLTAQEPLRPPDPGVTLNNFEKEAALGRQLAAEFRQRTTSIDSPTVQSYLNRLGQRIAKHVPHAQSPFTLRATADDPCREVHEPVALPGGYVFVSAALFLAAQDEAEFAGMLAHAMHHIAQRHGTHQAARGQVADSAGIPLIYVGGWAGSCSPALIPRSMLKIQRSHELEADLLAVQTMARAGFDPMALLRYIQRVQPPSAPGPEKVSSALPDQDQRAANMRWIIEKLPPASYPAPAGEFTSVQQELLRLTERQAPLQAPPTLKRSRSK
jgi:predicted Zn-dependent protease